jgi:hypothetical protein
MLSQHLQIYLYLEKNSYSGTLSYHGFGKRLGATEEDILERIVELVANQQMRERERLIINQRDQTLEKSRILTAQLNLSSNEVALFSTQ